jgi:DNA-binding MarR family transcriptional regulator
MDSTEHELDLLEHIRLRSDSIHQRDLARIVGLSLGMTNAILKRLAHKGWITIRKVNNRNIHYAVTPSGVEQITRRSYSYFKRTIKNIVYYREAIEAFVSDLAAQGYSSVLLVGQSDLDFIVEHVCGEHALSYRKESGDFTESEKGAEGVFLLYSESYGQSASRNSQERGSAYLQHVVSRELTADLRNEIGTDG